MQLLRGAHAPRVQPTTPSSSVLARGRLNGFVRPSREVFGARARRTAAGAAALPGGGCAPHFQRHRSGVISSHSLSVREPVGSPSSNAKFRKEKGKGSLRAVVRSQNSEGGSRSASERGAWKRVPGPHPYPKVARVGILAQTP